MDKQQKDEVILDSSIQEFVNKVVSISQNPLNLRKAEEERFLKEESHREELNDKILREKREKLTKEAIRIRRENERRFNNRLP